MTTAEMLRITDRKDDHGNPVPFSIHFVSLNRANKAKPSKHYKWNNAVRCGASHNLDKNRQIAVKPADDSHAQVAVNISLVLSINHETVA